MSKIMDHPWDDTSVKWTEGDIQLGVAFLLRRLEARGLLTWAGDMNAGKRSAARGARLKNEGMRAGEPDLRIYLPGHRLLMIELKRAKGVVSKDQKDRHEALLSMGFAVPVVRATTPYDAIVSVGRMLGMEHGVNVLVSDLTAWRDQPA